MEEQYTEEQSGGQKKKRRMLPLLVLILLVVGMIAVSFVLKPGSEGSREVGVEDETVKATVIDPDWMGGTVVFDGLEVGYIVVDEGKPTYNGEPHDIVFDWSEEGDCTISVTREWYPRISVERLISGIVQCHYLSALSNNVEPGVPLPDSRETYTNLSEMYAEQYLVACGERWEPLGWGNVKDRSCDIPSIRDLIISQSTSI